MSTSLVLLALALGCSEERAAAPAAPAPSGEQVAASPAVEPEPARDEPEPAANEPTTPEAPSAEPPVDLLRTVPTTVWVSSVYRGDRAQIARLVDGDLSTAWNSESGDLEGALIEVEIPAEAEVTSIELTAGFTRTTGRADLFTGNHRITRVRLSRNDDEDLGERTLDPESRELQALPVNRPGGVIRIEVTGLLPGTRSDWREVCVSELRVLGRPGAARADGSTPRLDVMLSDEEEERLEAIAAFEEEWSSTYRARQPAAALEAAEAAFPLPANASRYLRCEWAISRMNIREERVLARLQQAQEELEDRSTDAWASAGQRETAEVRRLSAEAEAAGRVADTVMRVGEENESARGLARALLALRTPSVSSVADDWSAMRRHAQEVLDTCENDR